MNEVFDNIHFQISVFRHDVLGTNWQTERFEKTLAKGTIIPFVRLYYPTEGEGLLIHHGKQYRLVPGNIYLVPPYADAQVSCPSRLVKYWGHFNTYILDSLLDIFTVFHPAYELPVTNPALCHSLFARLSEIYYCPDGGKRATVSSLEQLEGISCLALLLMPFFHTMSENEEANGTMLQFTKLLTYIEENLKHRLTLEKLAEIAHLNPTYLSNLFAVKMGLPLIQYCNNRRIRRAIDLIWSTNYSISEIAYKVGANNVDSFSRLFKRHTGNTPAQYKKLLKTPIAIHKAAPRPKR